MAEFADRNDQEKFYKGHYGITGTFVQKIKEVTVSYNYDYTDGLVVVDSTAGEVVITLPLMADLLEEREYRHIFPIMHIGGGNNVKIQLSGSETFANGATFFNLGIGLFCFDLYAINSANISTYGLYSPLTIKAAITFAGTFGYGSFVTTPAIVPFDTEKNNTQDEILLFQALSDGVITSTATGVGGTSVIATDVAHGLTTGDVITIAGTTDYNHEVAVTVLKVATFEFSDSWVSDLSGTWIRSPRFTVLLAGDYKLGYQMTIVCTTGAAVLTGGIYKDGTVLDDTAVVKNVIDGGTGVLTLSDVDITLAAGDVIDLRALQAGLSAGNLTLALLSIETVV